MNGLERYLGVIEGKPVDFLPRLPILMQFATEYIGSNYASFASDFRTLTKSNIECAKMFGIDQMNTMSDPYRETQGYGAQIIYEPDMVPYCVKHPLEDTMDLSTLKRPNTRDSERMKDRLDGVKAYKAQVGGEYSIMGWVEGPAAEASDLRRLDNFFVDLMDEEDFACTLMDLCVDVALEFAKDQVDAGAETIGIGDAAASQVSRDTYESLILPREQRLVAGIKKMGAKVRLHICGNITHLLPGISTLGIDVIDVDHMVDLKKVREILGTKTAIAGNLDPVSHVMRSNPKEIRERVLRCYEMVGNPFMVNAGCEIPSKTPIENLLALCEPVPYAR